MKEHDLNILIDRYYQGKSTPEEEAILRDSLKNNSIAEYNTVLTQLTIMSDLYNNEDSLDESFDEKINSQKWHQKFAGHLIMVVKKR